MRNYYLVDHMQIHTGAMKYMCEICGKGFRRPYELAQHRHDDERYKCTHCEASFATYNGYKTHMRKHTETPSLMCRFVKFDKIQKLILDSATVLANVAIFSSYGLPIIH